MRKGRPLALPLRLGTASSNRSGQEREPVSQPALLSRADGRGASLPVLLRVGGLSETLRPLQGGSVPKADGPSQLSFRSLVPRPSSCRYLFWAGWVLSDVLLVQLPRAPRPLAFLINTPVCSGSPLLFLHQLSLVPTPQWA